MSKQPDYPGERYCCNQDCDHILKPNENGLCTSCLRKLKRTERAGEGEGPARER